jgi:hypothetical protein
MWYYSSDKGVSDLKDRPLLQGDFFKKNKKKGPHLKPNLFFFLKKRTIDFKHFATFFRFVSIQ